MTATLPLSADAPPALPAPSAPPEGIDDETLDVDVARLLDVVGHRPDAPENGARVYEQLRRMASVHRLRYMGTPSVCTTALVHEAYLKLARSSMARRTSSSQSMSSGMKVTSPASSAAAATKSCPIRLFKSSPA